MLRELKVPLLAAYAAAMTIAFAISLKVDQKGALPSASRVPENRAFVAHGAPDTPGDLAIFFAYLGKYLSKNYGPFFVKARRLLPPNKVAELHDILLHRECAIALIKRGSTVSTTESRIDISKIKEETEVAVDKKLGRNIADLLHTYDETSTQRQLVFSVNQVLVYDEEPLTPSQIDKLIELLKVNSTPPLRLDASEPMMKNYIRSRVTAHENIIRVASTDLSPRQISALEVELDVELAYLRYVQVRRRNGPVNPM